MRMPSAARFLGVPVLVLAAYAPLAAAPAPVTYKVAMSGVAEVPPALAAGHGTATIRVDPGKGKLCYALTARGSDTPTMAHVHKGAIGVAGDVVVPLDPPANGRSKGCATADPEVLRAIVADPSGYYVNVHTAAHPAGAMRGQLG